MRSRASVAAPAGRWRAAFLTGFTLLQAAKLAVACTLAPLGDEAFYWLESRHPAWGYSDLPPMTAWLIRLGDAVGGHGVLAMRWPFLLLGAALPWLAVLLGRHLFGVRRGWQAGLLCLLLPLAGTLGVLALPDVPLTVACLLALYALVRAMDENRGWQWGLLGLSLAVAWMTHYRAAMPVLAGLVLCVATPRGRRQWRRPGFYVALGLGMLGLLPLAVSNWEQRGAGVAFQLLQRNPWTFSAHGLLQPLEQWLACSPLLYLLLLWAAWQCLKRMRRGGPWDVLAVTSVVVLAGYFLLGLFADQTRFRAHWPLPGYLPLLVVLPTLLHDAGVWRRRAWRIGLTACFVLAASLELALLGWLGLAATAGGAEFLHAHNALPRAFAGWREAGREMQVLGRRNPHAVLVADDFMLAAELAFQHPGAGPVYSLDSPLNVKYGRAEQMHVWHLDEAGLVASRAGHPVLLAVDETMLREIQRRPWLTSLCSRLDGLAFIRRLDLYGDRKRLVFYRARVPMVPHPLQHDERCVAWRMYRRDYLRLYAPERKTGRK